MTNKHGTLIFLIVGTALLAGCGNSSKEVINPTTESAAIENETTTSAPKTKTVINDNKDVSLVDAIPFDLEIDGKTISCMDWSEYNGNFIVSYVLTKRKDDYDPYLEDYDYSTDSYEPHMALIDGTDYTTIKDITVDFDCTYVQNEETGVWFANAYADGVSACFYDFDFNKQYEVSLPEQVTCIYTDDNDKLYYFDGNKIYQSKLNLEGSSETEEVSLPEDFLCSGLMNVFTDKDGKDYITASGMSADLNSYILCMNVDDNDIIYLEPEDTENYQNGYSENGNIIVSTTNYAESVSDFDVYSDSTTATRFVCNSSEQVPYIHVMNNGDVVLYCVEDNKITLADYKGGSLYASTSFEMDKSENNLGAYFYTCMYKPMYMGDDRIAFIFSNSMNSYFIYEWNMDAVYDKWDFLSVSQYDTVVPQIAEINYICNPNDFTPKELNVEFSNLRETADDMEQKYDIEIHIGEECSSMIGGYAINILDDYNSIEASLNILDTELSKYPEGFFSQLSYEGAEKVDFYLASQLIPLRSSAVSNACGFESEVGDESVIVVDFTNNELAASSIHHEIAHVIYDILVYKKCFNENEWNALNPQSDAHTTFYTGNYNECGYDDAGQYTMAYVDVYGYDNIYFIDGYSMTYITEDISRIFENKMYDSGYVDWQAASHLNAKLHLFSTYMRDAFNTSGWEVTNWEK